MKRDDGKREEINESEELAETLRRAHQGEHTFTIRTRPHAYISLGMHAATHTATLIGPKTPQA